MKLTNEEKAKLLMGKDLWHNEDFAGKLYCFTLSDATVGMRTPLDPFDQSKGVHKSIAYPSTQVLAQTFNKNLAYKLGAAVANDAIDLKVDVILGPGVNIKRVPTCGRNFEYFSEDPLLAGYLAYEYIKGAQDQKVGTCIKHYCCNNIEYARHWCSSNVTKQVLNEIYLRQFEIAIQAKPYAIMCSYNLLNGVRMSENKEYYDKLYTDFNFDGIIMSDWDAVKDPLASIAAGMHLEMPYNKKHEEIVSKAINENKIKQEILDNSSNKMLEFIDKLSKNATKRVNTLSIEDRNKIASEIIAEGAVLLKNDGILPLDKNLKIVVTGCPSFRYYYGGGSSEVTPNIPFKPLDKALKEKDVKATFIESTCYSEAAQCEIGNLPLFIKSLKDYDVALLTVGDAHSTETEGRDRQNIELTNEEKDLINYTIATKKKVIVLVYAGSAIDMSFFKDKVNAILYVGYPGQTGHDVIADLLVGNINPSGKLAETFPLKLSDVKAINSHKDAYSFDYDEGLMVGYRYFNTYKKEVLYPFGYGLSYSSFTYSNLVVKENKDNYEVSFDITNNSSFAGKETSLAFISLKDYTNRPQRELKGFNKILVPAKSIVTSTIIINKKDLIYYDENANPHYFNEKEFSILIGKNVEEIVLEKIIK